MVGGIIDYGMIGINVLKGIGAGFEKRDRDRGIVSPLWSNCEVERRAATIVYGFGRIGTCVQEHLD